MTAAILSVALVLTPAPINAPEEPHAWPTPVYLAPVATAKNPDLSYFAMDIGSVETTTVVSNEPTTSISSPPPPSDIPPPPPVMTPIEAGMNRLTELGATPYQLRVFGCLAWYESTNRPWVVSRTGDYGLWQINARFHAWRWRGRDIFDPIVNAEVAWDIYRESGFRAWTTARLCGV